MENGSDYTRAPRRVNSVFIGAPGAAEPNNATFLTELRGCTPATAKQRVRVRVHEEGHAGYRYECSRRSGPVRAPCAAVCAMIRIQAVRAACAIAYGTC